MGFFASSAAPAEKSRDGGAEDGSCRHTVAETGNTELLQDFAAAFARVAWRCEPCGHVATRNFATAGATTPAGSEDAAPLTMRAVIARRCIVRASVTGAL